MFREILHKYLHFVVLLLYLKFVSDSILFYILTFAKISLYLRMPKFFLDKIIFMQFKGGRMVEVKNEEQEETMREVGHLLLEVKCLARLGALASDSCIIDEELQLQDNIEYYFALRQVANLIAKIEHLLFD